MTVRICTLVFIMILFAACKKETINPYDDTSLNPPISTDTNYFSNANPFASLQNNVFQPYCNNAGCHDGSFEPDFRTIESSYSTLVYQPVIKNNDIESFEYRVKAGDSEKSVLYARLLADNNGVSLFDNNSQVMPVTADIVYDPNQSHSWHGVKNEYIADVKEWIDNGARDIFGNEPLEPNNKPQMRGCIAFVTGENTPLTREQPRGTIYVPSNTTSVDFWFSVIDDIQNPADLTYNKVKLSPDLFSFAIQPEYSLQVITPPIIESGYYINTVDNFYHKFTVNTSQYETGDVVFIKIYLQDNTNPVTEIPSNGSAYAIIKHFSFTIL